MNRCFKKVYTNEEKIELLCDRRVSEKFLHGKFFLDIYLIF